MSYFDLDRRPDVSVGRQGDVNFFYQRRRQRKVRTLREDFALFEVAFSRNNLFRCYIECASFKGQGRGADLTTYKDVSPVEAGDILGGISQEILSGEFRGGRTRPQRRSKGRPGEYRTLEIPTIWDRTVATALTQALGPHLDSIFLPRNYGFRPGLGTHDLLADLIHVVERTGKWVVATADIVRAFDSVRWQYVEPVHRRAFEHIPSLGRMRHQVDRYLGVIRELVTGGEPHREVGISQGCPYSPYVLNLVLDYYHDQVHELWPSWGTEWFRYADNFAYVGHCEEEVKQSIDKSHELLKRCDLHLKNEPMTIFSPYGYNEFELLGFRVQGTPRGIVVELGTEPWNKLRKHLAAAYLTPSPPDTALCTVRSWLEAYGPASELLQTAPQRVLALLRETGFTRLVTRAQLGDWMQAAYSRWQQRLKGRDGLPGGGG